MLENKLRECGENGLADVIKRNKEKVKGFFKSRNWTIKEMTGSDWSFD